ncbi:hypothetical protein MVEG_02216 [Podila verticillata NRRL 6337]|nr:hypothetical protein MVEG_02216 [Podila verticillata NRRL 6337]
MPSNINENNGDSNNITSSNPIDNGGRQVVTTIDGNSLSSSQVPAHTFPHNSQLDQQLQEQPTQGLDQPGASAPTPAPEFTPVALAPSSEHPMAFPSAPPAPQDSPPSDVPSAQIAPTQTASSAVPTDHPNPSRPYWCHECRAEITPMMVPDPMCPNCHSEFVEEIDPENDPRTFVDSAPAHLTGEGAREESSSQFRGNEPVDLGDLFRLFQAAFTTPQRAAIHQQRDPGQIYTSGTQYTFTSNPNGTTFTSQSFNPTASERQASQSQGQGQGLGPQWHSPPPFLAGLLNQFGIEVHYTTDLGSLGFGGMGGGLFNMAGNPGDYVYGQNGIDDIISQMMELQNRQHGPVGATEDIINSIPKHALTDAELEDKLDCSVCKDDFTKEDNLLQLPCKHIFHEDCIKPWLKVSGTCPTCRFSLMGGNNGSHDANHPGSSGATGATSSAPPSAPLSAPSPSSTGLPGAFPTNPSSSGGNNSADASLPHHEPLD